MPVLLVIAYKHRRIWDLVSFLPDPSVPSVTLSLVLTTARMTNSIMSFSQQKFIVSRDKGVRVDRNTTDQYPWVVLRSSFGLWTKDRLHPVQANRPICVS